MILGVFGAGGLGKEIYEMALFINRDNSRWSKIVFIDDAWQEGCFKDCEIYPYSRIPELFSCQELEIAIAIGEPEIKQRIFERVKQNGYKLANIIHPDSEVLNTVSHGEGLIVCKGAVISSDARLGDNICIQHNSLVGHDVIIGDNCQISAQSVIAGQCSIGHNAYLGMNSIIKENTQIGDYAIIGMCSAVFKDIPAEVIAMGNPARVIRKNENRRVFA